MAISREPRVDHSAAGVKKPRKKSKSKKQKIQGEEEEKSDFGKFWISLRLFLEFSNALSNH